MLRLRARFKPFDTEVCAWLNPWRPLIAGLGGQVDLILPSFPPFTLFGEVHPRARFVLLQQPSLEVLLSLSDT
jgi:hypothetical protein